MTWASCADLQGPNRVQYVLSFKMVAIRPMLLVKLNLVKCKPYRWFICLLVLLLFGSCLEGHAAHLCSEQSSSDQKSSSHEASDELVGSKVRVPQVEAEVLPEQDLTASSGNASQQPEEHVEVQSAVGNKKEALEPKSSISQKTRTQSLRESINESRRSLSPGEARDSSRPDRGTSRNLEPIRLPETDEADDFRAIERKPSKPRPPSVKVSTQGDGKPYSDRQALPVRNIRKPAPARSVVDREVRPSQLRDSPTPDVNPLEIGVKDPRKQALARFIDEIDTDRFDPSKVFTLYVGLPRLIKFERQPMRIQIGDRDLVEGAFIGPDEYSLVGEKLGSSVLNVWFEDDPATPVDESSRVHSYLLRVVSNPELKKMLEDRYKEIEDEINRVFPDSRIQLTLIGNKLVLSGECRDVQEATYILNVVRANVQSSGNVPNAGTQTDPNALNVNGSQLTGDPGTSSGFASGTPGVLNAGMFGQDFIVNLLRVPGEQQIMLRVVVAEVNRSATRAIGLNFAVRNGNGNVVFTNTTGGLMNSLTGTGSNLAQAAGNGLNNIRASLDNQHVLLSFSALRSLGYARSLAEPNIVALNGQSASFQAGGEFPVPIISGFTAAGLQGVSYGPYGVILQFTPMVSDRDRVRLAVRAVVSTRDVATGAQIAGASVPGQQTRNFTTVVELREGQTLAVAGLIQNNLGADSDRVPGLGDLPFVGNLTGFSRISHAEQELVILITPELVHPLDSRDGYENLALPGADIYEPGDLEFYVKGRIESRRSTDYRSPVRTGWDRMVAYRHCEQTYMDGPHGQTIQWQRSRRPGSDGDSSRSTRYAAPVDAEAPRSGVPALPDSTQGDSPFAIPMSRRTRNPEIQDQGSPVNLSASGSSRALGSGNNASRNASSVKPSFSDSSPGQPSNLYR